MIRVILALIASLLLAVHASAAVNLADPQEPGFPLVRGTIAAPIILPPDAPEVVRIAARDFATTSQPSPEFVPIYWIHRPPPHPCRALSSSSHPLI